MKKGFTILYLITLVLLAILFKSTSCKDDNGPEPPEALKAAFSASPFEGHAPLTVQFTDESMGSPTAWEWDFQGDGTIDAAIKAPSFTYGEPGFYDVLLVVSNSENSDTLAILDYIYLNRDDEQLNYDGIISPGVGELSEIPLKMGHDAEFGAITLSLIYDSRLIEVDTIEGVMGGFLSYINHEGGTIFIAWSSIDPLVIKQNDELFRIKANILTGIKPVSHYIRIGPGTEFADPSATILAGVMLTVPFVDTK